MGRARVWVLSRHMRPYYSDPSNNPYLHRKKPRRADEGAYLTNFLTSLCGSAADAD